MRSRSHRSILTLDKSEAPFEEQISEACSILGVVLESPLDALKAAAQRSERETLWNNRTDPRHEWTLKWLLQKLRASVHPGSPCLLPEAWLLLRCLIAVTHPAKAAVLLTNSKYTAILCNTLDWLQKSSDIKTTSTFSTESVSGSGSAESDFSQVHIYGRCDERPKRSMKRKRDGADYSTEDGNPYDQEHTSALFMSICASLLQLQHLVLFRSAGGSSTVTEQLKSALKCPLDVAANILGSCLYLLSHALQRAIVSKTNRIGALGDVTMGLNGDSLKSCVEPFLNLWEIQLANRGSLLDVSENQAFSKHCLLPSLLLFRTCRDVSREQSSLEAIGRKIQSLIVANAVRPLRDSVRAATLGSFSGMREAFCTSTIPYMCTDERNISASDPSQQQMEIEMHVLMLMCSFFDIAATSHSRATPKARREEDPFLRQLFHNLKGCAEVRLGAAPLSSSLKAHPEVLACLLEKAVKHSVQLDVSTIESMLEHNTNLLKNRHIPALDWTIISLCLDNNADVFVVPLSAQRHSKKYRYRSPNRFLKCLLANLTAAMESSSAPDNQWHTNKLDRIVLPLLRTFAGVRDLPSFLEHWKEQLDEREIACKLDSLVSGTAPSLWEDDELVYTATGLVETSLSPGQIESILISIEHDLEALESKVEQPVSGSTLVILDCVLAGCHSEHFLHKLSARARSLYEALAKFSLDSSKIYSNHRWRLWRILTTINWKWPSYEDGPRSMKTTREIAMGAFEVIDKTTFRSNDTIADIYREQSYAFSVMATLTLFDDVWVQEFKLSFRDMIEKSVKRMLDLKETICHQIRQEDFSVSKPLEQFSSWEGKSVEIQSLDTLYVSCFAQLLSCPDALSRLNTHVQSRMLEQLYQLVRHERRYAKEGCGPCIDYEWLYKKSIRGRALPEDITYLRNSRHLQGQHYEKIFEFEDPLCWNIDSVDYALALEGLHEAPLSEFNPLHRIEVTNRLLDVLLRKKQLGLKRIAEHLQLLTKFAHAPKKSTTFMEESGKKVTKYMNVFQNIKMDKDSLQERSAVFVLAEIISLEAWSVKRKACEDALCCLTLIILRHTHSTLPQEASSKYLAAFYQWIGDEMNEANMNIPMCPTGWTLRSCMLLVTMTALKYCHENRIQIMQPVSPHIGTLDNIRQKHFERVLGQAGAGLSDLKLPEARCQYAAKLECLYEYSDLLAVHPDKDEICHVIDTKLEATQKARRQSPHKPAYCWKLCDISELYSWLNRIRGKLAPLDRTFPSPERSQALLAMIGDPVRGQGRAVTNVRRYVHECIQVMNPAAIRHALDALNADERGYDSTGLTMLRNILYSLREGQASELRADLSGILILLCNTVAVSTEFFASVLSMQCITLFLQKQPQIISQLHIDTLLSTIARAALNCTNAAYSTRTTKLYIGLCRLFATTLVLHRTKLGGRYHLILPALQSLLRPLFIPHPVASPFEAPSRFDRTHASAYARLLSTLCDPSPSAVARPGHRQKPTLNDETKRAKSIAGQHLHYLIKTYCDCQLNGRLAADGMKEALEPGLWAVLGCMGPDVMRTMNSGLDSSGRAVWKGLYEDWKKVGQWQGG